MSTQLKNYLFTLVASFAVLTFTACDSDDDDERAVGQFLDSAVGGISYETYRSDVMTSSGTTDELGQFTYLLGETIVFYVGAIELPAVDAGAIITPLEIGAGTVNDDIVINITQFLQTLDTDGDPSNGITIDTAAASTAAVEAIDFDVTTDAFDTEVADFLAALNINGLVPEALAIDHLETTLAQIEESLAASGVSVVSAGGGDVVVTTEEGGEVVVSTDGDVDTGALDCTTGWTLTITTSVQGIATPSAAICSPAVPTLSVFQAAVDASADAGATVSDVNQTVDTATQKVFTATVNVSTEVEGFGTVNTTTNVTYTYDLVS